MNEASREYEKKMDQINELSLRFQDVFSHFLIRHMDDEDPKEVHVMVMSAINVFVQKYFMALEMQDPGAGKSALSLFIENLSDDLREMIEEKGNY